MILKQIATLGLAACLTLTAAERAAADGDALVGGIIGAIIGGVIVNEAAKARQKPVTRARSTSSTPSMSTVQRAANREVQTALNYFGFPVGTADGVLGRNSQAAIGNYQAMLGYTPTGQLTDFERGLLVDSYQRAIAGGAITQQQIAANPLGPRGLLLAYRDERAGVVQPTVTEAVPVVEPVVEPVVVPVVTAVAPAVGGATADGKLPSFFGGDTAQASLTSNCNKVSLMTSSNGGFVTAASMTDANFALNEQFCLARTYAIALGEDMASKINGFTPAEIATQCEGFAPAMQPQIAALSLKPQSEVMQSVNDFVLKSGMSAQQLSGTAKICLSVGYRTDNMPVALASALLLTALGQGAYAELMGHHLAQGFGTSERPDLALGWYDVALAALDGGAVPVFVPGQPERIELLRLAAYQLSGKSPDTLAKTERVKSDVAEPDANVAQAGGKLLTIVRGAEPEGTVAGAPKDGAAKQGSGPAGFILFRSTDGN